MEYVDLARVPDDVYKAAIEDMMATEGWRYFCAELYGHAQSINDIQSVSSMETLHEARGKLALIGFVLNYKEIMDNESTE